MANALNSLYGEGHAAATLKTQTRECMVMQGVRNQVVYTPQAIVDGLRTFWPEGAAFDPCSGPQSIVGATAATSLDGLRVDWPHRTYANPPFGKSLFDPRTENALLAEETRLRDLEREYAAKDGRKPRQPRWPQGSGLPVKKAGLKDWLRHSVTRSQGETVMLVPNRTNRKWMRAWRADCSAIVELNPLKFVGHLQAFPAPLVLGLVTFQGTHRRPAGCGGCCKYRVPDLSQQRTTRYACQCDVCPSCGNEIAGRWSEEPIVKRHLPECASPRWIGLGLRQDAERARAREFGRAFAHVGDLVVGAF